MAGYNKNLSNAIINQIAKDRQNYQQQTRTYATVSLCNCTVTNAFREKIIQLVINKYFDFFILLVIVANCVTLSLESTDPDVENKYIEMADYVFLGIFTCEMILKIIAMGFVM